MRLTMLAMVLGSILAMPLHAQQAAPQAAVADPPVSTQAVPGDGIRTEATVVVTGEQPGPGLWLVRKGGHDLWILGTLNPLPAGMQWQSAQIEQVIANAQEVIRPPRVDLPAAAVGTANQNPLRDRISGPVSCAPTITGAFDQTSAAAFRLSLPLG